jgi:hypothetical protein
VRRTHAHLERRERMLRRHAPLAHRLRVLIEALLHGLEHMLMLPSVHAPKQRRRALRFQRAGRAGPLFFIPQRRVGALSPLDSTCGHSVERLCRSSLFNHAVADC